MLAAARLPLALSDAAAQAAALCSGAGAKLQLWFTEQVGSGVLAHGAASGLPPGKLQTLLAAIKVLE